MSTIDLNADLGEGVTDDDGLLEVVSSANVACGFHAGDAQTMRRVCGLAARRGVRIGAHVSYRDLEGFGRRDRDVLPDVLTAEVLYQIGALAAFGDVAYVKPHGALYNRVVHDDAQAEAVIGALKGSRKPPPLVGLPGARVLEIARNAGVPTIEEGFADRAYMSDGRLVPRSQPGAVIHDPDDAARHAVELARSGRVRTLCVHGDTPGAVEMARRVRAALENAGFRISPFS
jgi:5-oxoprolinase (ATP-hydrolysing) subunit A